jgi:uncharacterized alpha-E superfamily protein
MPGGLSRSSPTKGLFIVSNQSGGISKDTWVLGPSKEVPVSSPISTTLIHQVENILPSRTGESLFWLGRYLERAVSTVRLMRIVLKKYNETEDEIHPEKDPTLVILLQSLTLLTGTFPGFVGKEKDNLKNPKKELISLATEASRVGTLGHSLQSFLSNGYAVRDRLSLDTWRILDSISEEWEHMKSNKPTLRSVYDSLDQLIIKLMAFNGLNIDNMTREASWRLLNIGRYIESSMNTCTILESILVNKAGQEVEKALMEMVLMCNESLVTYRYRYRSTLELSGVLNLLLTDEENPRSVVYQITRIYDHLNQLPSNFQDQHLSPAQKKLLEAQTKVRLCDINALILDKKGEFVRKGFNQFLANIIDTLSQASNLIYETYFSHIQREYSFVKTNKLPEI